MTIGGSRRAGPGGTIMDVLIIQYPRGRRALVWFDPRTHRITTDHPGLPDLFEQGVKDWRGRLMFPRDGRAFLEAMHDHLFLNGYAVRWARVMAGGTP